MYYNQYIRTVNHRFERGVFMDIASLSTAMSTQNVLNDVGVLMLSKTLNNVEDMGEGMTKIMESSVTPHLGQNIDYYV